MALPAAGRKGRVMEHKGAKWTWSKERLARSEVKLLDYRDRLARRGRRLRPLAWCRRRPALIRG
jgi:hypothetical protein